MPGPASTPGHSPTTPSPLDENSEYSGILFDEITSQLKAKAVRVKTGTMVDATVVGSASEGDEDAKWSSHRSRKAIHGYKAHVGADADTALVEKVAVTPGNAHDGRNGEAALPDYPGDF